MTASEFIGRARPSGISTIPDNIGEAPSSSTSEGDDKKTTGASGEKPGKAPEGEEWVTAEVIEGTSERVKQMIAFFDEMDDLVGLVRVTFARSARSGMSSKHGRIQRGPDLIVVISC